MAERCFRMKGSDPPLCGVHKVMLVLSKVPLYLFAPQFGHVTCLKCPVSQYVVE
jgi:hypothetical protein